MRENRIRAVSMRSAGRVCSNACRVASDFFLRSAKALTADLGSALRRMASLSFSNMGQAVCYHLGMWETLQLLFELLWYLFFVGVIIFLPAWIWWKVFGWFFPSDD